MLRRVVPLVLGLVLLAGCTGSRVAKPRRSASNDQPASTAPSSPISPPRTGPLTTGPGVLPGQKPPVEGAYARQHTSGGAIAFAIYYVRAFDWSIATNDPYLIEQISASACRACTRAVDVLNNLRDHGYVQRGGRITVHACGIAEGRFDRHADYVVRCTMTDTGAVVYTPTGETPSVTPPDETYPSLIFVSWIDGSWQIIEQEAT
jgi:hypothetical protein